MRQFTTRDAHSEFSQRAVLQCDLATRSPTLLSHVAPQTPFRRPASAPARLADVEDSNAKRGADRKQQTEQLRCSHCMDGWAKFVDGSRAG